MAVTPPFKGNDDGFIWACIPLDRLTRVVLVVVIVILLQLLQLLFVLQVMSPPA